GENSVLTATSDIPGSSFLWSTGAITASITVSPAATTTYNVTVTSPEGCVSTGEVTVNVFPNPVLTITASSGAICFGDPSVISVSSSIAATTFEWSTGETTANITVSPASTSTYFITGTSANGCTGTASIEIIVNPLPVISVAASDANICVGENSVLTATSDIPGSSFLWSTGAITASITVSPAATTTYNVTVTSPEGCVSTGEVTVNVFPNPVLTITASDIEICNGASATINASSNISGTAFEWNTGSTNSSITVGPNTTTTYSITGTAANGCIGTTNIEIIVNPLPTITTTVTDSIICDGESVTLTAFSDITGSTYQWSTGASTPEIIVAPNLTNTYYLTVTSPEGCVSTANSTITVNPNPIASIIPSSGAICMGSTATLTVNSNIAINSYLWNTAETNPSIIVTPATTSIYTVTITTAEGCSGTSDISVFVNPLPDISVTAPAAAICIGSSLDLTANSNHPSTGYEWSTGQTTPSINVSPAASSTYSVTGTDINGCTGEAEFIVTVNPLPDINIVSAQNEICEGMSVELTATSNIPDTDFEWNTGQTSSSIIVSPPASTTYEVTGTDANGCTGSNRITIQVNPNPTVTINPNSLTICPGDTATLNASSAMAITYAWNTGATTTSISVWPSNTSSYSVTGTDINGCIGIAAATVVVRNAPVIVVSPYNPKICYGDSVTLIASGAVLYDWTPATGLNTNVGHIVTSSPDSTTTYIVAGVDLYGCQGSTNVTVTVHPIPTVDFRADETDICQATVVHFSGMASPSIQSWEWDFGDPASGASNSSSMQNPMHAFFETGTYTIGLSVVTTAGCKNSIQKPSYIIVHPNPIASFARTPDITTLEYPTIQFYDQSLGEKSRLWDFDDPGSGLDNNSIAKNPTHTYSASGEYWATLFVENEWGCLDSVSNRIIINPTWDEYIPSAFSPNGDGNNDVFRPMGFNIDFTQYQMYIYDRWGKEIFDTDNIEEGWDGRVNDHGETVQQDVYVYLIILTDISGLEHQFIGHVTVVK
ncbi:MAG: PKD domain-containing protein, partial [Bacteroidales bacterium]